MNLINDYFLLYHGVTFDKDNEYNKLELSGVRDDYFELFSILLSITRKEFNNIIALQSFDEICKNLDVKIPKTSEELSLLQYTILHYIKLHYETNKIYKMHETFKYLQNECFLTKDNYKKLLSLFEVEKFIAHTSLSTDFSFKKEKEKIKIKIDNIITTVDTSQIQNDLEKITHYVNEQNFSIGITGVMNSGKSTMLNALMGDDVLGTAVVPETANLTIIKYDTNSKANVVYWDTEKWNNILKTAQDNESINDFVKETTNIFGNTLDTYILQQARKDTILVNKLDEYTSAKNSNKMCNLIQYVELYTKMDFLKDGVEIVDTPGLDDPVIQREEITKEYISQCDMMLHLMNVAQSTTKKDVEFIIDALLYQNVTKLLIVITRADTVTKEQLEEVVSYTKKSIEKELKIQNKDSSLNFILNTIEFIPISGKMALLHRTNKNQEALAAGFTLENTGIIEIENYLEENLFGKKSIKGELIIKSAKTQLLRIIEKQQKVLAFDLEMSSKTKEELEEELQLFILKKEQNNKIHIAINDDISYYKEESINYLKTLDNFLESEFSDLQNIIRQRVISDVRYSFEKKKEKPSNQRIESIIQTAIKDGIIDIIRDYKHKLIKKFDIIQEQCLQKYQMYDFVIENLDDMNNTNKLFANEFKSGFLTSNYSSLIIKIFKSVQNINLKHIEKLDIDIKLILQNEFYMIQNSIQDKTNSLSKELLESFFDILYVPLKNLKERTMQDELIYQKHLQSYENNEEDTTKLSINIYEQIKVLNQISQEIKRSDG